MYFFQLSWIEQLQQLSLQMDSQVWICYQVMKYARKKTNVSNQNSDTIHSLANLYLKIDWSFFTNNVKDNEFNKIRSSNLIFVNFNFFYAP